MGTGTEVDSGQGKKTATSRERVNIEGEQMLLCVDSRYTYIVYFSHILISLNHPSIYRARMLQCSHVILDWCQHGSL